MSQVTPLASGTLNGHDQLIIELVEAPDPDLQPTVVAIRWPCKATVTTAGAYDQVAANVMRLLANASTTLAGLKVWKKL
ncbi:MAG: hypothetical protein ACJ72M_23510 [Propionibacteriaceae bacterium]|jgi:hypothetical protein